MTARLLLLAAALSLSAAAPAGAQQPQTQSSPRAMPDRQMDGAFRLQQQLAAQQVTRQAQQRARAAEVDRANRATALINEGKCEAAHQLVLAEGDRRMAEKIQEVCSQPPKAP